MNKKQIEEIKAIYSQQSSQRAWSDEPHGYRTDIGYLTKRATDGETVLIPLFETRANAKRGDVLVALYARNLLPELLIEIERLRSALAGIQEIAEEALRTGEGGDYFQIEANARAALDHDEEKQFT